MSRFVLVLGSPTDPSRTDAVTRHVGAQVAAHGHRVEEVVLRELPADALVHGRLQQTEVAAAVRAVESADAVVVGTPIFQGAYSGLLKVFLDVLPRGALAGKHVLPLATGGSLAHALAVDHTLVPVLRALQPAHVARGRFVLAQDVLAQDDGATSRLVPTAAAAAVLEGVTAEFLAAVEPTVSATTPALRLDTAALSA